MVYTTGIVSLRLRTLNGMTPCARRDSQSNALVAHAPPMRWWTSLYTPSTGSQQRLDIAVVVVVVFAFCRVVAGGVSRFVNQMLVRTDS